MSARRGKIQGLTFSRVLHSSFPCEFEREAEQFDRSFYVKRVPKIDAHPAALGEYVVCFSATRGYEFVSDFLRKGNVNEVITVHVADFSTPQQVLRASKAVGLGGHARPLSHRFIDSLFNPRDWHVYPRRYTVPFSYLTPLDVNGQETVPSSLKKRSRERLVRDCPIRLAPGA